MAQKQIDLSTLSDAELVKKLAWYEARNKDGKFQDQIDAIREEGELRYDEAETAPKGSIVKDTYKAKYAAKGNARGCGDWLQDTLQVYTLDGDGKLRVSAMEAILDANGVKHDHWNRTTAGWQGRLRMSGGLALRSRIAKSGILTIPDVGVIEVPADVVVLFGR